MKDSADPTSASATPEDGAPTITKNPAPAATKEPPKLTISDLVASAKPAMTITGILAGLAGVSSIVPYIAITYLAEGFQNQRPWATLWTWLAVGVVGLVVSGILYGAALGLTHFAEANLRFELRKRLVKAFSRMPLGRIDNTSAGVIRKAVADDTSDIHTLVAHLAGDFMNSVGALLAGIVFLFVIDWRLSLAVLGVWIILLGAIMFSAGSMTKYFDDFSASQTELSSATVELVDGIKEVKNFGGSDFTKSRFDRARQDFSDFSFKWLQSTGKPMSLGMAFMQPGALLVTIVPLVVLFLHYGWSEPYQVLPFMLVGIAVPQGLMTLISLLQHIYQAQQAAISTIEILSEPVIAEGDTPPDAETLRDKGLTLALEDVTFGYQADQPVLENISVEFQPGTVTALVGPSGGGKTTLARLVARFYDVTDGRVTIGGHDVREVSQQWLLSQVAIVFQDIALIHDTVRANISLGKPDATDEEIEAAARAANIHNRIMRLPQGYDTVIGDRGGILSGGENQRVTLARAFLLDAPILILDEATAQADAASEKHIHQALSTLCQGRTVLVIAHRLATVSQADQILVVEDGKISARGKHDELLESSPTYRSMWELQQGVAQ